jgi:peroxiredoxin
MTNVIRWAVVFGILLVALLAVFSYQRERATGRVGFPAPDFTLRDLNGRPVRLSGLRGKVVFLNIWATWCPPCRMEMPSMESLHRRLQGRDFVMLAVSEDESGPSAVRTFVDEMKLTFSVLLDPEGSLPPRYGVTGYPETFIIDRKGHVVEHFIGPEDWANEEAFRYFSGLLDEGHALSGESAR